VYRDSFPGVRFVMQVYTAVDFATLGASNRTGTVQGAPPVADRYARLLDMGLGIDSTPVSEAERASVLSALGIIRQYVAEAPGVQAHRARRHRTRSADAAPGQDHHRRPLVRLR